MRRLCGALLIAVTLLVSAYGWNHYDSLSDRYKPHIDKAIRQANAQFMGNKKHINYYKVEGDPAIGEKYHFRVMLKTTKCDVADNVNGYKHRNDCAVEGLGLPWIDCVVCNTKTGELVDCALKKKAKSRESVRKQCLITPGYRAGHTNLLAQKSGSDAPATGCVGCV
ncbi:cystatin-like protein [Chanos chanos]|uniref:Cystatin-like protein n=1 Tax=Chanos chanos TaxID=29144 RepID=A0A6J2VFN7_CHACN|nr:cystatin-like protein [Chanos chanos]